MYSNSFGLILSITLVLVLATDVNATARCLRTNCVSEATPEARTQCCKDSVTDLLLNMNAKTNTKLQPLFIKTYEQVYKTGNNVYETITTTDNQVYGILNITITNIECDETTTNVSFNLAELLILAKYQLLFYTDIITIRSVNVTGNVVIVLNKGNPGSANSVSSIFNLPNYSVTATKPLTQAKADQIQSYDINRQNLEKNFKVIFDERLRQYINLAYVEDLCAV